MGACVHGCGCVRLFLSIAPDHAIVLLLQSHLSCANCTTSKVSISAASCNCTMPVPTSFDTAVAATSKIKSHLLHLPLIPNSLHRVLTGASMAQCMFPLALPQLTMPRRVQPSQHAQALATPLSDTAAQTFPASLRTCFLRLHLMKLLLTSKPRASQHLQTELPNFLPHSTETQA